MSISSSSRVPSMSSVPAAHSLDGNSSFTQTPVRSNNNNNVSRKWSLSSSTIDNSMQAKGTTSDSASIHSVSTQATSFDGNWLPETHVFPQPAKRVTLTLSTFEINALRKSWNEVITGKKTRVHHGSHHNQSLSNRSPAKQGKTLPATPNSKVSNAPAVSLSTASATSTFTSSLFCVQFYHNLISMMPQIEKLIPSIKHQASAFAGVINIAMSTLEDLSRMNDSLDSLGRLHARILGIDSPYFEVMGNALIKTFRDRYQSDNTVFELSLEEAWIKLYCFLANSILQGGIDPIIEYGSNASALSFRDSDNISMNESVSESFQYDTSSAFKLPKDTIPPSPAPGRPSPVDSKRESNIFSAKASISSTTKAASDSITDKMRTSSRKLRRSAKGDPDDPNCIIM